MFDVRQYRPETSSFLPGVEDRWIALAAYIGGLVISLLPMVGSWAGWVVPLVILLLERNSRLIRFSAAQSLTLGLAQLLVSVVILLLSVTIVLIPIGVALGWIANIAYWVLLIIASYYAVKRSELRIPYLCQMADRMVF
ncbi:MAG: DUF4870 domain-containing protein [Bacillota bacterium]|nr:DUF4870 domain-containing protein [Bacillota bacterium]